MATEHTTVGGMSRNLTGGTALPAAPPQEAPGITELRAVRVPARVLAGIDPRRRSAGGVFERVCDVSQVGGTAGAEGKHTGAGWPA
jgi:hypothetical protein